MPPAKPVAPSILRKAAFGDIGPMADLLEQLFSIEADFAADRDKQRRGLAELLARDDSCVLVCEIEGQVVGMCSVQVLVSTAEGGNVGLLEDFVIAEPWRRQGLGTALLAAAEQWSRAQGLTRLQLLTDATNGLALDFYRRTGWGDTRLVALRRMLR
jgi:GNAT superfamily N-acetyltransferase